MGTSFSVWRSFGSGWDYSCWTVIGVSLIVESTCNGNVGISYSDNVIGAAGGITTYAVGIITYSAGITTYAAEGMTVLDGYSYLTFTGIG